jgi:hypothetical protein
MGASAGSIIQHWIDDPEALSSPFADVLTVGGHGQRKDDEAEKRKATLTAQEVKQRQEEAKQQEEAQSQGGERRQRAINRQRQNRGSRAGRAGTILTSPLGVVEEGETQRRTVLGG